MSPPPSESERGTAARSRLLGTFVLLLVFPIAPAILTGWLHPRRPDWTAIRTEAAAPVPGQLTLDQVRSAYANALWVDARSATDFAAGHVTTGLNEPNQKSMMPLPIQRYGRVVRKTVNPSRYRRILRCICQARVAVGVVTDVNDSW